MLRQLRATLRNQRTSTRRQRRDQHLLDVKVRSQKAAQQRNQRLLSIVCMLTLFLGAVIAVYQGTRILLNRFLWQNPDYRISKIETSNDGVLTRTDMLASAGIVEGENIFSVSLAKARENLNRLPQVERAEVRRIMPNKIAIAITERKPVAWISMGHEEDPSTSPDSLLIDRMGRLIDSKGRLPEYIHLPVISHISSRNMESGQTLDTPEIKAALELLRMTADGSLQPRLEIRKIDLSQGYCMIVTDRNRAQVTFSLDHIDWQLERLAVLLDHIEQGRRELQTANLMVQRNVPVTFFPSDEEARPEELPVMERAPAAPAKESSTPRPAKRVRKQSKTPAVRKAIPVNSSKGKHGQG